MGVNSPVWVTAPGMKPSALYCTWLTTCGVGAAPAGSSDEEAGSNACILPKKAYAPPQHSTTQPPHPTPPTNTCLVGLPNRLEGRLPGEDDAAGQRAVGAARGGGLGGIHDLVVAKQQGAAQRLARAEALQLLNQLRDLGAAAAYASIEQGGGGGASAALGHSCRACCKASGRSRERRPGDIAERTGGRARR